jgi:hypothetical protein
MTKKLSTLFLFCFLSTLGYPSAYGENNPPKKDNISEAIPKKKIPPLPRHILFPDITYSRAPDKEGEFTLDFSKHRFWIVIILASWNEKSKRINRILNKNKAEFEYRDIGILALYSQDTEDDVDIWREQNHPSYENEFASQKFLDKLKNPKVPSVWLLGEKGELLLNYELPTERQFDIIVKKSFILTGF